MLYTSRGFRTPESSTAPKGPEWYPEILRVCLQLAEEAVEAVNARAELLLHVLCVCVRILTRDQAMRLLGITDRANVKRLVRGLVARGLVSEITVWAKPVPEMREPLFASQ